MKQIKIDYLIEICLMFINIIYMINLVDSTINNIGLWL